MKKTVAINCSPRTTWNTATLVRKTAQGAQGQGAGVKVVDLYQLDKAKVFAQVLRWREMIGRKEADYDIE